MPSYFLTSTTSYLGAALKAHFTAGEENENEIVTVSNWEDPEEIFTKVQSCDLIILDLVRNPDESASVLNNLRPAKNAEEEEEEPKNLTIVAVSSVMAWNQSHGKKSKPLSEAEYKKRSQSATYKDLKQLETAVLSSNKENIRAFVLAPGILYGNGEESFAELFKEGWLCENTAGLPVLGEGKNVIPTLHVKDVGVSVAALVAAPPEDQTYVVVTDNTNITQKQLIESISKGIGLGVTRQVDEKDEKVLAEFPNHEIMLVNLTFDPESSWQSNSSFELSCPGGLLDPASFQTIRTEFVNAKKLRPVRSLMLGPPGSGKTMFSKKLAKQLYLPYVSVGDVIREALAKGDEFSQTVKAALEGKAPMGKPPAALKNGPSPLYRADDRPRLLLLLLLLLVSLLLLLLL